ncbi:hypothetical protein Tco_1353415 [Tanacetum coccineum]
MSFETETYLLIRKPSKEWRTAPTPLSPSPSPSPLSPLSSLLPRIPSPPLLLPSPTHRDIIPEANMPPQKRARFAASSQRFEVGESSAAAAARHPGSTLARDDIAILRALVSTLKRERRYHFSMAIAADQEATYAQQAWTHAMECIRRLQAKIRKMAPKKSNMSAAAIEELINQRVADALAKHEANQNSRNGNGNDNGNGSHNSRSDELILMCSRMVPDESDKVEKYNGGLPDSIQGSVMASKPRKL